MSLVIRLDGERLLSRNQLDQMHWRHRHRISERIKKDVWAIIHSSKTIKKPAKPWPRASCSILSYRKKLLDPDNLMAGAKYYIDALVTNGLLLDDKPENIELKIKQVKARRYAVKITLRPLMQTD